MNISTIGHSPLAIVGAGLSGLTLGLSLKRKGIAAIIYDRATSSPRYNYGITLHEHAYRPLLRLLEIDEKEFKEKLAVNAQQGGDGSVLAEEIPAPPGSFRCHRSRLEALLSADLSISWDKRLKEVKVSQDDTKAVTAHFEDGDHLETSTLISCEGPHSTARKKLTETLKLNVLNFAVYNGQRRLKPEDWAKTYQKYFEDTVLIQKRLGNRLLEISINDFKSDHVEISYIYSRAATQSGDPLHNPDRPIAGATDIPEEFFEELETLQNSNLDEVFKKVFNAETVRDDRLLHWLMRDIPQNIEETKRLASDGVLLIGDAAHATPILGGYGANMAIQDGLDLADYIAAGGTNDFSNFLDHKSSSWTKLVQDSRLRIDEMHTAKVARGGHL